MFHLHKKSIFRILCDTANAVIMYKHLEHTHSHAACVITLTPQVLCLALFYFAMLL